jgi:hypothetical protein
MITLEFKGHYKIGIIFEKAAIIILFQTPRHYGIWHAEFITKKSFKTKQNKSSSGQIWNYMQKLPFLAPKHEICFAYSIVRT